MISFASRLVIPKIRTYRVPPGRPGTLVTARMIGDLIRQGAKDFVVRQKAIQIFRERNVAAKDRFGEVRALFEWVQKNIRYTRDTIHVELLHSARRMLELKAGDCDDMTILLGAMLMATGHRVRLVLAGFKPHKPHSYSHIYPEVNVNGRWIAVDATMPLRIGWAPPALWKKICELGKGEMTCSSTTP